MQLEGFQDLKKTIIYFGKTRLGKSYSQPARAQTFLHELQRKIVVNDTNGKCISRENIIKRIQMSLSILGDLFNIMWLSVFQYFTRVQWDLQIASSSIECSAAQQFRVLAMCWMARFLKLQLGFHFSIQYRDNQLSILQLTPSCFQRSRVQNPIDELQSLLPTSYSIRHRLSPICQLIGYK